MNHMKLFVISIIIILTTLASSIGLHAQENNSSSIFEDEKYSVEIGVGLQNGGLGIRGKYYFSKYIGGSVGIGYLVPGPVWNLAIEVRSSDLITNRLSPFFNVMYGINSGANLYLQDDIYESKLFRGISLGLGIKLNMIKKLKSSYMTLGANYRFIDSSQRNSFIDKVNKEYGKNYSSNISRIYPVFGLTIVLND